MHEHEHEHTYSHSHPHEHGAEGQTHEHEHTDAHSHPHSHEDSEGHAHEHPHADHGHDHDHHGHSHAHEHGGRPADQLFALMKYMAGHNADHTRELEGLAGKAREAGAGEAYDLIMEAVRFFDQGNESLSKALEKFPHA